MITGHKDIITNGDQGYLNDYKTADNIRNGSKMKISKEVHDALVGWKESMFVNNNFDIFVGRSTIDNFPKVIHDWWANIYISDKENNNRLITIIRWVNGEDVFEVEKPKKWVVRSKETDEDDDYWYIYIGDSSDMERAVNTSNIQSADKFETKEEAESWANAHQEVIGVNDD